MNSHDSKEKSINGFERDSVSGDGIMGGGKSIPIIILPDAMEVPMEVSLPEDFVPDPIMDHANDGNMMGMQTQPTDTK